MRITLLTDSITFVVEIARRIGQGKSNSVMMSGHFVRHDFEIVGYFSSQVEANSSRAGSASASVAGAAWLLGLTTVLSLNEWSGFHPLGFIERFEGKTLFDLYDFLTANIMLPLGALLMAVFAGWIMTQKDTEDELAMASGYGLWRILIRYVAPIGIGVIFLSNLW